MKSRQGFVSNSSTTSFVLLVKPEKAEAVDFILRSVRGKGQPSEPVTERREKLVAEVTELGKDIAYINRLITKLNKTYDKIGLDFHNFLLRLDSYRCSKDAIRNFRQYPADFSMSLNDYQSGLNRIKEDLLKDKEKCEKQLKLLEGNESWSIMSFEDDANFGTLDNMVHELLEKKDAVVLSEETS